MSKANSFQQPSMRPDHPFVFASMVIKPLRPVPCKLERKKVTAPAATAPVRQQYLL